MDFLLLTKDTRSFWFVVSVCVIDPSGLPLLGSMTVQIALESVMLSGVFLFAPNVCDMGIINDITAFARFYMVYVYLFLVFLSGQIMSFNIMTVMRYNNPLLFLLFLAVSDFRKIFP